MKKCYLILVFLLGLFYLPLSGTDDPMPSYDTLRLKQGSKIILAGSVIKIDKDSTVIINSGLDYRVKYPRGEAGDIFFDSLEIKADRSRWTQELHDIIITSPKLPDNTDSIQTRISAEQFISQGGKFIRNIVYNKLEPFGPSIFETTLQAGSSLEIFGNDIHRITQDRVIKNHILFKQGDLVDPHEFADNERILRELPFIQDARIYVQDIYPGSDSVDITILTKDNFSIGVGGELYDYDAGKLDIFDKNLFGFGHELHVVFNWDARRSPWMGNEIYYIIRNMGGSFIDSKLRYAQLYDSETYQFELARSFFTPDIKWAGAFNMERSRAIRYIYYLDSIDAFMPVKNNLFDVWAGRAFLLNSKRNLTGSRINLIAATRLYRFQYIDRPEVSDESFYQFQNRNGWLTSLSFSSQSFFKSNLILDFGRTEDIPQGMLASLIFGPEINEFNERFYTGFSFSQGRYLGNFGYLYTRFEAGGFAKKYNYIEQGVVDVKVNYFTPLFIIKRFKFRHFISTEYVRGFRRFEDEYIGINNWEGIRGFRSNIPLGQQKVIFNYEADAFTPYYLYGFRFVCFGFVDIGMVGPESVKWHDGSFFSGLGLGVRIRNERLVFETISIRLGYYPNHPEKSFPLFVDVYGEERLNPDHFYVRKPSIVGF